MGDKKEEEEEDWAGRTYKICPDMAKSWSAHWGTAEQTLPVRGGVHGQKWPGSSAPAELDHQVLPRKDMAFLISSGRS